MTPTNPDTQPAPLPADTPGAPQTVTDAGVRRGSLVLPPPTHRYELGPEIARGGMGAIHLARDRNLDRELALKVMLERYVGDPLITARFVEEALFGGQLQHPGLVPVHELGTLPDGRPFIALKLIKGRTLAAILAARRTPADDLALRLGEFTQVCQAIGYVHEHRVIHRDLKPGNIMVGKHGEVQVMDWGIAKFLAADGPVAVPEPMAPPTPPATEVTPHRADSDNSNTQAGDMLGTPAYMPPEQARGQVSAVDERADVFGLGAILCEILTGKPAYLGPSREEYRVQAMVADPAPIRARLDACGADPLLIDLAKRCLDPDPTNRPRHGGAVAEEVEAYLAGVQQRLEKAEVARAAAQVRATEERKRRRVQLALFAALIGVLVASGVGFALVREQRLAREAQTTQLANEALGRLETLRDQAAAAPIDDPAQRDRAEVLWRDALAAADRADQLGATLPATRARIGEQVTDVRTKAADAEKQRRMLAALEDAHDAMADIDDADFARVQAAKTRMPFFHSHNGVPRYERAFRDYGIDIDALTVEEAAARVKASPIAGGLVRALDDWHVVQAEAPRAGKLLAIAGRADSDPVRGRIRDAVARGDRAALTRLAAEHPDLPPPTALLLAFGLEEYKDLSSAAAVLERTARRYPGDFWVLNLLSLYYGHSNPPQVQDAARVARAALALRPNSHVALIDAADELAKVARFDESIEYARRAVERRPDLAVTHLKLFDAYRSAYRSADALRVVENAATRFPTSIYLQLFLGYAQENVGQLADAERTFHKLSEMNPGAAEPRLARANVLIRLDRKTEARAAVEAARQLDRSYAYFDSHLGNCLMNLEQIEPAIASFREAIKREPAALDGWTGLAGALTAAERYPEAVEAARTAVQMNPQSSFARAMLAYTLRYSGQSSEALQHAREAVRLVPANGFAHGEIGLCLENLKQYAEAEVAFRAALAVTPDTAEGWLNLGRALRLKGDSRAAVDVLRETLARHPASADAQRQFGLALQNTNQLDAAAVAYREAIRLDPKASLPHNDLAIILEALKRGDEALAEYKAAFELEPTDPVLQTNYGIALVRHGRHADAEAAFRAAISKRPTYGPAHRELYDLLSSGESARSAETAAIAARWAAMEPTAANAHNAHGNALYWIGQYEGSLPAYRRAASLKPKEPYYHDNLGGALQKLRRYDEAADAHQRAWDLAPANGYFAGRLIRARTLAEKFDAAEKAAAQAVEKLPRDPDVRSAVGALRLARKDLAGAEAEMRRAIELAPTVADYYADLGRLLDDADRVGEAVAVLRRGVERSESGTQLATQLASALSWAGHPDEAVKVATGALAARPADFALLQQRGRAHFDLRDYDESITDLAAALKAAEKQTDVTPANRAIAHLWLAQAQYLAGRYPDALAAARASERLVPGAFAAKIAADATDSLRFEARADAIKSGTFRPKDSAGKAALATYLVVENRELARAYELFAEALDADPKLAEDRHSLHRYNAARAAAAGAGRHARAFAWLFAEWVATPPDIRARRAGIWLRDPLLAPARDDAALDALPWLLRCNWRLFWGDLRRATELPSMKE